MALKTFEAEITKSGFVTFNEPYRLDHHVKAYITILPDPVSAQASQTTGQALLQLLKTEKFIKATASDGQQLDLQIQNNRNAWND